MTFPQNNPYDTTYTIMLFYWVFPVLSFGVKIFELDPSLL